MKKIIPIITLCLAIATATLNVAAIICACMSLYASQVKLISIPIAIVGLVLICFFAPFAFLFKKDILCKIALYIDLVSLAVAIAAVAIAFSAL
ncbi:MAG: hypothetical protein K2K13_04250 [Clostridiales bacterium]|nr:hypothetical protein [Clostridiales bacterium]